jgi:chromosome condensin MukBEF complex kleisin-like MukF subunit
MRQSISETLQQRDGLSAAEADRIVEELRDELFARLDLGEMPFDLMEEVALNPIT